jgi:CRP-like cAMP-binding protein
MLQLRTVDTAAFRPTFGENVDHDVPCGRRMAAEAPWAALAACGSLMTVRAGGSIAREGDLATRGYRVVSGTVRVAKQLADGRRQILDFIGPEDGLILADGTQHEASLEAIDDVRLVSYPRSAIEGAIDSDPGIARWLLGMMRRASRRASRRIDLLGRRSADERVAGFLKQRAEISDADLTVVLPMSRTDIADHLGIRLETVSRAFAKLKASRCIRERDRHRIELLDRDRLEACAEPAS